MAAGGTGSSAPTGPTEPNSTRNRRLTVRRQGSVTVCRSRGEAVHEPEERNEVTCSLTN